MVLQFVENVIKTDRRQEYIEAAKRFVEDSKKNDPGCLWAEVYANPEQQDHVFIISKWEKERIWIGHLHAICMNSRQLFCPTKTRFLNYFRTKERKNVNYPRQSRGFTNFN
jgi:quinol monooxygenase YgiN